ncbi:MAG TPA: AraC family transcriptional regulator [Planctomicrobium sp.]|nr:AraC family transcriptional regulator [Planctomicrobium sp.]
MIQSRVPSPGPTYDDVFRSPQGAPNVEGTEIRRKNRRSLQLGRVSLSQAFPGPPMPFYYVSMCLNNLPGRYLDVDYGGGWFRRYYNRGSLTVVPPYATCRFRGNCTGPFQLQFLAFSEAEIQEITGNAGKVLSHPPVRSLNDPFLTSLMLQLWPHSDEQSLGEEIMLEGAFISFVGRLLVLENSGRRLNSVNERHGNIIIAKALDYIEGNLSTKISLSEIAAETHVSRSHLVKVFKRVTGRTVYDHLLELRIRRAKELMTQFGKSMTLAEIAAQCGFANHSHLTRVFTHEVGTTPQAFREQV